MSLANLVTQYVVQYGFRIMGAMLVIVAALFVAKSVGQLFERWLHEQNLEPPLHLLLLRLVKAVIVILGMLIALDQLGLQIAPLVAGLGVAGLGVGLALQGVLSNIVAGLSIIFTKPFRVGEHVSLLGVHGDVAKIDIFTTTLVHPDHRIVIPNRKVVGEILHNFGTIRQLDLSIGVSPNQYRHHAAEAPRPGHTPPESAPNACADHRNCGLRRLLDYPVYSALG